MVNHVEFKKNAHSAWTVIAWTAVANSYRAPRIVPPGGRQKGPLKTREVRISRQGFQLYYIKAKIHQAGLAKVLNCL